jgi:hypothetical protein
MATTSKYFVQKSPSNNQNFLDFDLNYGAGSITTVGESIIYNGTELTDAIFVRPGLTYNLTSTLAGLDKIYLTGNMADYTISAAGGSLVLTRNLGTPTAESVTVSGGSSGATAHDSLIFANGTVSTNALWNFKVNGGTALTPSGETSLAPTDGAAPGAVLNATVKAFAVVSTAVGQAGETFASTKPGISYIVNGSEGVDKVYVAEGETVNATSLNSSVDLIYMRGKWSDYTKTLGPNGGTTQITFTRTLPNGNVESVTVSAGNSTAAGHDQVIFADGAVMTNDARDALVIANGTPIAISSIPGYVPTTTTPLFNDTQAAAALAVLKAAADANNANGSTTPPVQALTADAYSAANVRNVDASNVGAINSALDSAGITAGQVGTTAAVQRIVDAYKAIIASADGPNGTTSTPITGDQYAAIGVTGLPAGSGTPLDGSALKLLDEVVDKSLNAAVNTQAELQAMADAANHVLAAAGGTPTDAANLSVADLNALGFANVNAGNIVAIRDAIKATTPDSMIDQQGELAQVISNAISAISTELAKISAAAQADNASGTTTPPVAALDLADYTKASVSGVDSTNIAAINSALDSAAVIGTKADSTSEVQDIVNAYKAILASADGPSGTTSAPITGDQYALVGVTGLPAGGGTPADGSALKLLDEIVDKSLNAAVNTESKLQAMADAANHVLTAAGGTAADAANLSIADLAVLGFTATPDNIIAIRTVIQGTTPDTGMDQQTELAAAITNATNGIAAEVSKISAAAGANNAGGTVTPPVAALTEADYGKANVSGVTAANVAAINSALDSANVDAAATNTTAELQGIVNVYNAILASADGTLGNTSPAITGEQYALLGVTGVPSGSPVDGSALKLLDEVVDKSLNAAVNTEGKLQAMADAANRVLLAAGGTVADANALSVGDLNALGFTEVTADNIVAVRDAIKAVPLDSSIDQQGELATVIGTALTGIATELSKIAAAAQANNASGNPTATPPVVALNLTDYTKASVSGVDSSNIASINSALDSLAVNSGKADSTGELQDIVDAYKAILASADGPSGSVTTTPITGDQYALIGVTGLAAGSTAPAQGTALYLLDSVLDVTANSDANSQPEVQAMADAALHVMGAASNGTVPITATDLTALGITGITTPALLAEFNNAVHLLAPNGVDTKTDLQLVADGVVNTHAVLSTTLSPSVANLDVASNLVFTSSIAVNATTVAGKYIHITDLGGSNSSTGYHNDTNTNSVDIELSTAIARGLVSIDSATHTKITINPMWDLDLSSNYSISIDAGAFVDRTTGRASDAVAAINFSTVTPGVHVAGGTGTAASEARAAQTMNADGTLAAGKYWMDVEGLGNISGVVTQLGDLANRSYVLVAKNYAVLPGGTGGDFSDGIRLADTNVGVANFGIDDYVYFDAQLNDATKQVFDSNVVTVVNGNDFGGAVGQNALDMATASSLNPAFAGARIMLGLEGNTQNRQYSTINDDGPNHGWATDWHQGSQPVIMA